MAEADALTLAYLHAHPQEAALVLDPLPAAQVAGLWAELPARLAAPCAALMRPAAVGQALLLLDVAAAAALLAALPPVVAAAVLRALPAPRRAAWLALLPTRHALTLQALMQYPPDAVGALTDTAALSFGPQATVAQAVAALHEGGRAQDLVLVDGGPQGMLGGVPVGALLMAHPGDGLLRWCQPLTSLPALMPAAAALAAAGWREGFRRPVLDNDGRLLGLVSQLALQGAPKPAPTVPAETALGWAGGAYWRAVAGLGEWLCGLFAPPAAPPAAPVPPQAQR